MITYNYCHSYYHKGDRLEEPIPNDLDEIEVLKRFDSMLRTLVCRGRFTLLSKPLTLEILKKSFQDTLHELCVIYAFDGVDYIGEIRENIQYVVLQAALILTITIGLYVSPPDFEDENLLRAFSSLSGFAGNTIVIFIVNTTTIFITINIAITVITIVITITITVAFSHVVVIIGSTISAAVLNMGIGPIDTFIIYKSNRSYCCSVCTKLYCWYYY